MSNDNGSGKRERRDWGRVLLVTRLEKMVDAHFVQVWSHLITKGLRPTDGFALVKDRVAHQAANDAIRLLLSTDFDSLCFIDSDFDGGPEYLEQLRALEDGWDFDIFQGFYTRRGWPPEAIWFKETELGDVVQTLVWKDNHTEETAMVGFHNCLIRREVFEGIKASRPGSPLGSFTWAYYPIDEWQSEDAAFCQDARALGYRIGSTTKVKCGHISRVISGWNTYHEYLSLSGILDHWQNYYDQVEMIADYTGESYDQVMAKATRGSGYTKEAWERLDPKSTDEIRSYYGDPENGYLYDLLAWNVSPTYQQIVKPLEQVNDKKVLIIGAGIGGEIEALKGRNAVAAFELEGVLSDFLHERYKDELEIDLCSARIFNTSLFGHQRFDLIVMVDVIEHIPTDELEDTLDAALGLLSDGGEFYLHNNFGAQDLAPQHFDHAERFDRWLETRAIERLDDFRYQQKAKESIS